MDAIIYDVDFLEYQSTNVIHQQFGMALYIAGCFYEHPPHTGGDDLVYETIEGDR